MARDVNLAILNASTAYTASGLIGAAVTCEGGFYANVRVLMGAITGTTPTCALEFDVSLDGGTNYKKLFTFPGLVGTDDDAEFARAVWIPKADVAGGYKTVKVKLYAVIAGTSPSFTIKQVFVEPLMSLGGPGSDLELTIGVEKLLQAATA